MEPIKHRMYVVVRQDLAFKFVQGSHALAQFALEHPHEFKKWNNETIVFLEVFNGLLLEKVHGDLINKNMWAKTSTFIEPDLKSNLPTAFCVYEDGTGDVYRAMKKLKTATK